MAETTPMQLRMNDAWDRLRQAVAKMYPDKAEAARLEIVIILCLLESEARKWEGIRDRLPLYPEGMMFEALGYDMPEFIEGRLPPGAYPRPRPRTRAIPD